ncbi:MAG: SpoIIE family protein phosphatase [Proteobacteria bacterium]|nr:SpoIIE family protein phosphatase [Pseudomonadota bacterium]
MSIIKKSSIMKVFVLFIPFLFFSRPAFPAETLIIDDSIKIKPIGLHLEYLKDDSKALTINDIIDRSKSEKFEWKESKKKTLAFGYQNGAFWIRFTAKNITDHEIEWYLQQNEPKTDYIDLYMPGEKGKFKVIRAGDYLNFSERPIKYRNFVFPVKIKAKEAATYYMRFQTSSPVEIILKAMSPDSFHEMKDEELPFFWMIYGVLIVMVLYNFFVFVSVRDISYLYYIFYIIALILYSMGMYGFAFQHLWPRSPWWANYSILLFLGLFLCFVLLFGRHFMRTWEVTSHITDVIFFRILLPIEFFFSLFPMIIDNYKLGAIILMGVSGFIAIMGVAITLYSITFRKSTPKNIKRAANIFLLSFVFLIIGAIATILKGLGYLPINFFTTYSIFTGAAIQVVCLSFGLADRINVMKNELQGLNLHLEDKVRERTDELSTTMEDLQATNAQLIETRDELWGEMELAKKIQTVLLPEEPKIPGYEIAAHMEPADEVGGDYYDVINFDGKDWLIIGDVSGHGVPAGLVMMMVQTSIHSVLQKGQYLSPEQLLEMVNRVIHENIKKMSEDKYMTITVFACHDNGEFHFAGLHQDIMIYRAVSKDIELVETKGMWIGIMEDIKNMLPVDHLILNERDVMLLYTDGITESVNNNKEMFSDEKLIDVFRTLGDKSTEGIKQGILTSLNGYTCDDDVTFMVLKRNAEHRV